MRSVRAAALLAVLAVVGVLTAAPASAHAEWLGSDPEEGAVLTELPAAVVMTYSEDIAPDFVDTAVVPPGGEPIPTVGTADGVDVSVDLAGAPDVVAVADQAGQWQLVARVVSADGHPVEHTTTFQLEPAVPAEPTAASEPTPAGEPSTAAGSAAPVPAEPSAPAVASAEPSAISSDPVAGAVDGLPGWAVPLVGLALLGAGAAAVVVHLRRGSPEV